MPILEEQSLLFAYIKGVVDQENNQIEVVQANSLKNDAENFFETIEEYNKYKINHAVDIFCIVGMTSKMDIMQKQIDSLLSKIISQPTHNITDTLHTETFIEYMVKSYLKQDNMIHKRRIDDEDVSFLLFYFSDLEESCLDDILYETLNIWISAEKLQLCGKQMITETFLLRELNGRRILATLTEPITMEKYLLVEGGLKVYLREENPYQRQNFGIKDKAMFSIPDIQNIIINPVYALNKCYYPEEIFQLWQKVFLYVLATANIVWDRNNLKKIYAAFLDFIENHICNVMPAESIIPKEQYYDILLITVEQIREYLQGKEEAIISKDYLLLLKNYHCFIEPMRSLLDMNLENRKEGKFDLQQYKALLSKAKLANTTNDKGKSLENVVAYLVEHTDEWKVMAKRIRTTREEIDISCCNVSIDSELWNVGALLLIECKNWKHKVGVQIVRELGYIMFCKGCTTTILVSKNGITKAAQKEIEKQAILGKYILTMDLKELSRITMPEQFIGLMKEKYKILTEKIDNDFGLLGE